MTKPVSDQSKRGLALTFFGPGCWLWQLDDGQEGVTGSREEAIEEAKRAASDEQRQSSVIDPCPWQPKCGAGFCRLEAANGFRCGEGARSSNATSPRFGASLGTQPNKSEED